MLVTTFAILFVVTLSVWVRVLHFSLVVDIYVHVCVIKIFKFWRVCHRTNIAVVIQREDFYEMHVLHITSNENIEKAFFLLLYIRRMLNFLFSLLL